MRVSGSAALRRAGTVQPAFEFLPAYLRVQHTPPAPLPRIVLYCLLLLLTGLSLWATFGHLDIVASADGKLIPRNYLKIVQPAEGGVVRELLVEEGATVVAGQPVLRLDPSVADADTRALRHEFVARSLQLRRIDAELSDGVLTQYPGDPIEAYAAANAQFGANRLAYEVALAQERATVQRIGKELSAAREVQSKLQRTVPIYRTMAERFRTLKQEGYVSELYQLERERDHIEKEQDLKAQAFTVESLEANLAQAGKRLAQVTFNYRQQLQGERAAADAQLKKATEDLAKQHYRNSMIELTAPQAGVVKDLAVHAPGSVVAPGAVLLTVMPFGEELQAEVMVRNLDAGFVRAGQRARVKVIAYPFQKYGMLDGKVIRVSTDATDVGGGRLQEEDSEGKASTQSAYRVRIALPSQRMRFDSADLELMAGMQVGAEIKLGDRSVLEYLLAPVQKAWHDAARER